MSSSLYGWDGARPGDADLWRKALDEARLEPVVTITGAFGPDAGFVNGVYALQDMEGPVAAPSFRGCGGPARWLFRAANGTWCVGAPEAKALRMSVCWAYSAVAEPGVLPARATTWHVAVNDQWERQALRVEAHSSSADSFAKDPTTNTALFDFETLDSGDGGGQKDGGRPGPTNTVGQASQKPSLQVESRREAAQEVRTLHRVVATQVAARKQVPQMLKLHSPHGQTERAGIYVLHEDETPHGYPLWKHATSNNLIYPMLNGKWGVAGVHEYNNGDSNLAYIFCPMDHAGLMPHQVKRSWKYWGGSSWVIDNEITVKVAQDANAPKLTLIDCMSMEDELIYEYDKPEFQRRFHEAWAQAYGDAVRQREARVLTCLPIQIRIIQKFGFAPSLKGVQQSVRAFQPFDHMPQLAQRADLMTWLVDPGRQAVCPKPPAVQHTVSGQLAEIKVDTRIRVVARLLSGEELGRVPMNLSDTFSALREAVESAVGGVPIKLVFGGRVLADGESAVGVGLTDGSEVFVVFLHFKVLTASSDCTAKLLNTTTGECELTFLGHEARVRSAALSHDESRVVTASFDGTAKLFDAATAECKLTFQGHRKNVNSAVFSSDDSKVLTGSDDGTVKIHDSSTGGCIQTFPNGGECVNSAVFSPDGRLVLLASGDSTAKVLNLKTGTYVQRFGGHRDAVNSARFSSSGREAVTASDDCTSKVFEVSTGSCNAILLGHSRPVNSAVFSQDGRQVLSASDDCTVRLFDVTTGGCMQLFRVHDISVSSALFLPDEQHVLVASSDHRVRLFHIKSGNCQKTLEVHTAAIHHMVLC